MRLTTLNKKYDSLKLDFWLISGGLLIKHRIKPVLAYKEPGMQGNELSKFCIIISLRNTL
jgi:hypothetical protein